MQLLPFSLFMFLVLAYNKVDSIMLERMLGNGAAESGTYAAAYRLLDAFAMIPILFASFFYPLLSKQLAEKKSIIKWINTSSELLISIAIIIAIALSFFANDWMRLLYPTNNSIYLSQIFSILILSVIPICIYYIFSSALTAKGSLKILNLIAFGSLILNVLLNIFMIPHYHAYGAALATIISLGLAAVVYVYFYHQQFKAKANIKLLFKLITLSILMCLSTKLFYYFETFWLIKFSGVVMFGFLVSFILKLIHPKKIISLLKFTAQTVIRMHEDHLQEFNLIGITKAGLKYKKHIFLVSMVGLVGGLILAFVIKPKYEASTIFYPSANSSISKSILDNNNLEGLMEFGGEDQTDQMLQILNSNQLMERVISKFNLINHYQIDKDDRFAMTKVKKQFASNADFKRTDYLAIKITITDENSEMAAQIANYVGFIIDSIKTNIQKVRTQQAFEIIKTQYLAKKKEIDSLQAVLTKLRVKGIYDYESQSEVLSTAIVKAETQFQEEQARLKVYNQYQTRLPDTTIIRAKGRLEAARAAVSSLKPRIETFGKYSGDYLENEALFDKQKESLAMLQSKYENALVDYNQTINQKFIIDKAQKPEMKAYPNRLLVVIVSVFFAFLIGLFMTIYSEIINPRLKVV